jgi:hypothetical protein
MPALGAQTGGLQESACPLDAGQPDADPVGNCEDGFEALRHSAPLRFFIVTSTQCDNGGLPDVAVAVRDAGENDNLTFFGCPGQNSTHEA